MAMAIHQNELRSHIDYLRAVHGDSLSQEEMDTHVHEFLQRTAQIHDAREDADYAWRLIERMRETEEEDMATISRRYINERNQYRDSMYDPYGEPIPARPAGENMNNLNFNFDMTSRVINISDPQNNLHLSGTIQNEYSDFGVRSNGSLDGYITGDLIGEMPVKEVQSSMMDVPLFFSHMAVETQAIHIIIVGAGGTGGYIIPNLGRYIASLINKGDSRRFKITLVDGDKVEEKNLVRQNFIMRDLNQPKALVLANRYSAAFGVEIEAVTEMADDRKLRSLMNHFNAECDSSGLRNYQTVVIGCVDNNKARREIHRFASRQGAYWIDSGNERSSGQVVTGFGGIARSSFNSENDIWMDNNNSFNMPFVSDLYPEIMDEAQDHVGDDGLSCAERATAEEQNIFVNMTAAVHITNFARQIIAREPMPIYAVEFNIKGVNTVHYNTREEFFNIGKVQ